MSKRNRDRRGDGQRPQDRRDATADDRAGRAGQGPDETEAAERAALRADLESPEDATAGGGSDDDNGYSAAPESQRERWIKYGSNVVLVSVVVVVLAVLVTWLAQRPGFHKPIDTTKLKLYSLKPQTLQVLRNVDKTLGSGQRIELVSLYSDKEPEDEDITSGEKREKFDYAGPVRDLLQEYQRNSGKIDVEIIDPVANPAKVDALIERVTNQYGGEVKRYQDFLNNWPKTFRPIKEAVNRENAEVAQIAPVLESSGGGTVSLAVRSVASLSDELDRLQSQLDRRLKQRPPDYKGATDDIHDLLQPMSSMVGQIVTAFERVPGVVPPTQPSTTQPTTGPSSAAAVTQPSSSATPSSSSAADEAESKVPAPLMKYLQESLPRYRDLKRQMDDVLKQIAGLGELKLDELKQKLRVRNGILVLGPTEMRSLSFADVWQINPDVKQMLRAADASQIKPEFAGEQQITTAIWGVTAQGQKKPKVVFVRPGGQPLATAGSPFQRGGPLAAIAQRLRDYNFDVAEKDLSGQWAMQSRQMGAMMPPEPEPTDEEMKSAVWVVLDLQSQMNMGGAPPADIGARLAAHLDAGGSALVLASPRGPDLTSVLGKWGLQLRTDAVAVHEPVKTEVQSGDFIEEAKKIPFIFVLNQYGDHLITSPMRSLDTVIIGNVAIRSNPTPGATVTPLLSTPSDMKTWGETDLEKALGEDRTVTYDPKTDVEGPVILAAAAERQGSAGRLVVVGGIDWAAGGILRMPDPELARKGVIAARFPGNAELFTNSIFWLSKMDTMIAISPSAMQVSRIKQISEPALRFWHWGILIIGLPVAVIAAGTIVYLGRRD